MLIQPDCIPCIFQMAVSSLRELGISNSRSRDICREIALIPSLAGNGWDVTSPNVIEKVILVIKEALGEDDPFTRIKDEQNTAVLSLKAGLQKDIDRAPHPLQRALNLAIMGNTIDLMLARQPANLEKAIRDRLDAPLPEALVDGIEDTFRNSRRIVYLGDNCGEIVLDGILLDFILKRYDCEITLIVRSVPVMNDVTLREVPEVDLPEGIGIRANGIQGPYPGTRLRRCSAEVQDLIHEADLIISKGGGNFDSFGEEDESVTRKTLFLLLSKCRPYCDLFKAQMLDPVLTTVTLCERP